MTIGFDLDKIGFDLDDVVADFFPSFLDFYNRKYGVNFEMSDMISYDIWEIGIGRTREEAVEFIDEFYESERYDRIPFVEGAGEGLDELGRDNELLIITSRLTRYKPKTDRVIKDNFNGRIGLFYTEDFYGGNSKSKADVCDDLGVNYYVEDCYRYALSCADRGIETLLLKKPWNENCKGHENIIRVNDWSEILKEIGIENG